MSRLLWLLLATLWIGGCSGRPVSDTAALEHVGLQNVDTLRPAPVPGAEFDDARAVAVDPLGFLYVADAGRDVVVKLAVDGAIETVLGGPGSREGEFDEPSGLDPTNGLILFVADAGNNRIQKFSRSNAYLGSIPLMAEHDGRSSSRITYRRNDGEVDGFASGRPLAIASSDAKDLFAVDADRGVVLKWDENLRLEADIGGTGAGRGMLTAPVDLTFGARSTLYVADQGRRAVVAYDAFGSLVRTIGEGRLAGLRAVAASEDRVFVGLEEVVVVYDARGRLLEAFHIQLDAPLVDLAAGPRDVLYLLTRRRLYSAYLASQ